MTWFLFQFHFGSSPRKVNEHDGTQGTHGHNVFEKGHAPRKQLDSPRRESGMWQEDWEHTVGRTGKNACRGAPGSLSSFRTLSSSVNRHLFFIPNLMPHLRDLRDLRGETIPAVSFSANWEKNLYLFRLRRGADRRMRYANTTDPITAAAAAAGSGTPVTTIMSPTT